MNSTSQALDLLFDRIPRRHNPENIKEINSILLEYEDLLISIEAENEWYEKNTSIFFEGLDNIRLLIKKSNDNKASKKNKDLFFDDASVALKDSMESLKEVYADGSRKV